MNSIVSALIAAILSLFGAQQITHNAPAISPPPALAAAAATSVEPAEAPTQHVITYTVQAGDTLSGIAQSFNIPVSNILATNDLSQGTILHPGEQLIIPNPQTAHAASDQTTLSQNVKSELKPATSTTNQSATSLLSTPEPAFNASNFVSRSQFTAAMAALGSSVEQLLAVSRSTPLPQYVASDGNPIVPYAGANAGVNFSDLTASEIPALNYFPSTSTISTAYGGTGISNSPTFGQLLLGNGSGGYDLVSTSSLGIVSGGGGSSNVSTSSQNTWSALQVFAAGASTTQLSAFNGAWFGGAATSSFNGLGQLTLANLTNSLLAVNASGQVVSTSSIETNLLTGALGYINGTSLNAGGSITVTAATSTLLTDNNTFTGTNIFNNGLLVLASSTIGDGNQNGGLSIYGGATTTGKAYFASNVGIGTTTPGSIFSVNNILNLTSATSTFYSTGGINLTSGCFSINGTCVGGSSGFGTVGSGTQGQFAFYNAAGTTLSATSSLFLSQAGNVGIGTTSPFAPLSVAGNAYVSGNLTASSTISASSFSGAGTELFSVPVITATAYHAFGDSITAGSLASTSQGYVNLIAADTNTSLSNYGQSGRGACDMGITEIFTNENPAATSSPLYTLMVGTNDAWYVGAGPYESVFNLCEQADIAWLGVPSTSKVFAQAASNTTTGTWTDDNTYQTGMGLESTTNGSTLSMPITTGGNPIYIWYLAKNGNGGTFTYQLDGGTTHSLTAYSSPAISSPDGASEGVGLIRITGVAAGSHTVLITVTSATSAGNVVSILAIGSPAEYPTYGSPKVFVGGVIREYNDASSTNTAAYNADVQSDVNTLYSDGVDTFFVPVRNYVNDTTDMNDSDGLGLHPGNSGHEHLREAFESVMQFIPNSTYSGGTATTYNQSSGSAYNITFTAQNGATSGNTNGGSINLNPGLPYGSGSYGSINFGSLLGSLGQTSSNITTLLLSGLDGANQKVGITNEYGTNMFFNLGSNSATDYFQFQDQGTDFFDIDPGYGYAEMYGDPTLFMGAATSTSHAAAPWGYFSGATGNYYGNGGDLVVQGGGADTTGYYPNYNGGNLFLAGGLGNGSGRNGNVILADSGSAVIGDVGIGTTSPYARLTVWGPDTASTSAFAVVNSASTTVFSVFDNGNSTYSGSIFQSSDQRLKTDVQSLDSSSSLSALEALNPVSYLRIDQPGTGENLGFIAQQVQPIFPQLVSTTSATALTPGGTLTLNYEGLIAPIVSAIQELDEELTNLADTVAGFAQSFTSAVGNFGQVNTNDLCVGSTCVTPAQFQAMVAAANGSQSSGQGSGTPSSEDSQATDTPPVIQINGDNPALIQVGAAYNDLGATITGPQQDLNLGISTFVNGIAMSPVQIDTSAAATDTIDYVATDQNGLTSTSTRTVIIEAPANDNQATSTPANDNSPPPAATSTSATTTAQ